MASTESGTRIRPKNNPIGHPRPGLVGLPTTIRAAWGSGTALRRATMAAMTTVGLVLGAGGLHAAAQHAGVLAALAEATGWGPRSAAVVVGAAARRPVPPPRPASAPVSRQQTTAPTT